MRPLREREREGKRERSYREREREIVIGQSERVRDIDEIGERGNRASYTRGRQLQTVTDRQTVIKTDSDRDRQ